MLLLERLSRALEEEGPGLGDLLLRLPLSRSSSPGLRGDPCLCTLYVCMYRVQNNVQVHGRVSL